MTEEPSASKQPARDGRSTARLLSFAAIAAAIILPLLVFANLRMNPRTDDAQIRANVVGVAPQVSGTITALHVVDNQAVKQGDLLMELDPRVYQAEMESAKAQLRLTDLEIQADKDSILASGATLKERQARSVYADSYFQRVSTLLPQNYVSADKVELARTEAQVAKSLVEEAEASLARARNLLGDNDGVNVRRAAAQAALAEAELRLAYCKIYATCDGYVTDLQIAPGTYAKAGEQIFSLVDRKIWFVLANFRETDIGRIRPGMPADIYLMASSGRKLRGYVQGISKAVYPLAGASRSTAGGEGVLSQVNPTIDFILLAQRYPIRIVLAEPEAGDFRMGGTAMVIVHTGRGDTEGLAFLQKVQSSERKPYEQPAP